MPSEPECPTDPALCACGRHKPAVLTKCQECFTFEEDAEFAEFATRLYERSIARTERERWASEMCRQATALQSEETCDQDWRLASYGWARRLNSNSFELSDDSFLLSKRGSGPGEGVVTLFPAAAGGDPGAAPDDPSTPVTATPDPLPRFDDLDSVMMLRLALAAAIEALKIYGEHAPDCVWRRQEGPCSCGWDRVMMASYAESELVLDVATLPVWNPATRGSLMDAIATGSDYCSHGGVEIGSVCGRCCGVADGRTSTEKLAIRSGAVDEMMTRITTGGAFEGVLQRILAAPDGSASKTYVFESDPSPEVVRIQQVGSACLWICEGAKGWGPTEAEALFQAGRWSCERDLRAFLQAQDEITQRRQRRIEDKS